MMFNIITASRLFEKQLKELGAFVDINEREFLMSQRQFMAVIPFETSRNRGGFIVTKSFESLLLPMEQNPYLFKGQGFPEINKEPYLRGGRYTMVCWRRSWMIEKAMEAM